VSYIFDELDMRRQNLVSILLLFRYKRQLGSSQGSIRCNCINILKSKEGNSLDEVKLQLVIDTPY
jgi:hypothetical protein